MTSVRCIVIRNVFCFVSTERLPYGEAICSQILWETPLFTSRDLNLAGALYDLVFFEDKVVMSVPSGLLVEVIVC